MSASRIEEELKEAKLTNQGNDPFYDSILKLNQRVLSPRGSLGDINNQLEQYRRSAGLVDNCDLVNITKYFIANYFKTPADQKAPDPKLTKILLVGSGARARAAGFLTGRPKELLQKVKEKEKNGKNSFFKGSYFLEENFTLVEKNKTAARIAQRRYPRATVLAQDIRQINKDGSRNQSFDIVLWLFSGLADFSMEEQAQVLTTLFSTMKTSGVLIIDIPQQDQTNATDRSQGSLIQQIKYGNTLYRGVLPSPAAFKKQLKAISNHLEMPLDVNVLKYYTDTNKVRFLTGISTLNSPLVENKKVTKKLFFDSYVVLPKSKELLSPTVLSPRLKC